MVCCTLCMEVFSSELHKMVLVEEAGNSPSAAPVSQGAALHVGIGGGGEGGVLRCPVVVCPVGVPEL